MLSFLFNCTEFGTERSVGQSYDVGTFRHLACSSGPLAGLRIKETGPGKSHVVGGNKGR